MTHHRDQTSDAAFERVLDLGTIPPAAGAADVHAARTTVAHLPDSFLDDLRRGGLDSAERLRAARGRAVASTIPPGFTEEVPTSRGKEAAALAALEGAAAVYSRETRGGSGPPALSVVRDAEDEGRHAPAPPDVVEARAPAEVPWNHESAAESRIASVERASAGPDPTEARRSDEAPDSTHLTLRDAERLAALLAVVSPAAEAAGRTTPITQPAQRRNAAPALALLVLTLLASAAALLLSQSS